MTVVGSRGNRRSWETSEEFFVSGMAHDTLNVDRLTPSKCFGNLLFTSVSPVHCFVPVKRPYGNLPSQDERPSKYLVILVTWHLCTCSVGRGTRERVTLRQLIM